MLSCPRISSDRIIRPAKRSREIGVNHCLAFVCVAFLKFPAEERQIDPPESCDSCDSSETR